MTLARLHARLPWVTAAAILVSGVTPLLLYWALVGRAPQPTAPGAPWRETPLAEQAALVLTLGLIKPLYMLLALAGLAWLRGQRTPGLLAVRWSLACFLLGETLCAVNILAFNEESPWLEYGHSWGMVLCLAFLAFGAMEALDRGLLHFGDPLKRCAFAGVCGTCARRSSGACLVRRALQWAIPLVMVVALMPLNALPRALSYNTAIFTLARNLSHAEAIELYEIRFSPLAALALLAAGWLLLVLRGHTAEGLLFSKLAVAAALGHLAFGFLRLALIGIYAGNLVWFTVWEEITELLLVAGVIVAVALFRPELNGNRALGGGPRRFVP